MRRATAAEDFASFAGSAELTAIPAEVVASARLHLLDTLGCGLAAHALDAAPYACAALGTGGDGRASTIGVARGTHGAAAALANGIICHALDFDDTHAASIAHVSSVVVPAALAAAEERGASLGDLIAALVVGNEITCRVGMPAGDAFHRRGFHPTAICGVFGATAAVGRLAGLRAETITQALGIAGSMASGLLAYLTDGSATKRIHPGWMAHAAHVAVALAASGATGPAEVLEGRNGIYQAFLGRTGVAVATGDLGSHWETPAIAFKPYPACHFLHAAVDAMAEISSRDGVAAEAIDRITVLMPQAGIDMVLAPLERKRRPATAYEAKFSAPFALGALLTQQRVDVTTFTDPMLTRAEILDVAARVDYEPYEYATFPESFPAGVRVLLRDGSVHEEHLAHQRGGPAHPMSSAEVREKFTVNAALGLGDELAAALAQAIVDGAPDEPLDAMGMLREAEVRSGAA